jgi:uncharacterized protein with PQ loop repeat
MRIIQAIGMLSGIIMLLFNIPLILRIIRRRSSGDISLVWVIGVWSCVVAMLPSSLQSPDPVLVVFGIINSLFFSAVFFHRSLLSSGGQKNEQSWFVNVYESLQNL